MVFVITGADTKSGATRTIRVRAVDEKGALVLAKENGIYPYKVELDKAEAELEARRTACLAEEARKGEEERLARQRVNEIKRIMKRKMEEGQPVFLYDTVYLPVNSILMEKELHDGFDIPELRAFGVGGWEVMQVIPRTVGIGLENLSVGSTVGQTWGGGSGGNVLGVHVILKRPLRRNEVTEGAVDELAAYIRSNLSSFDRY